MRSPTRASDYTLHERMMVVMWLLAIALAVAVAEAIGRVWARMGASGGPWGTALSRLRRDGAGMLALRFLLFVVAVALFAHWLAPFDPNEQLDIIALASR